MTLALTSINGVRVNGGPRARGSAANYGNAPPGLAEDCRKAIVLLEQLGAVTESDALKPINDDRDFEAIRTRGA